MRTYFYKITGLVMVSVLCWGFTANFEPPKLPSPNNPLLILVSHPQWGTSLVTSSTDKAGLKTMKITFREDFKKVFYIKNTPTSKTIYEIDGTKRAIIIDNTAGTVTVTEDGKPAAFNDKTYQDICVAAALDISGETNYFPYSVRCTSTIVAIYSNKDESIRAAKEFTSAYLDTNKDCGQIGDIKSACATKGTGCVAFTAFLCEKTGCE